MVAGEASGDLHGARLLSELSRLVPDLTAFGLGGDEMQEAGLDALAHSAEISVVGLTEVLKVLPRARQVFARIVEEVERRRPAAAVLIDFPDFNLRLAAELRDRGVRVLYYVSPQVWAWRRRRIKTIARIVDRMLVLFPFEVDFYRDAGVPVTHVGHPLVDEVPEDLTQLWERGRPEDEPWKIAMLPGSRPSEVEVLLPIMLDTIQRLASDLPIYARIIRAPTIPPEKLEEPVRLRDLPVRVVGKDRQERFQAIADSHVALCASGTATLEVGLLGTPMVVVYRLGGWTYFLARLMVRLPHVSLVNLVLGEGVVPELIQKEATPEGIAREVEGLLGDRDRIEEMRRGLSGLRRRLGDPGASRRAAREVASFLAEGRS